MVPNRVIALLCWTSSLALTVDLLVAKTARAEESTPSAQQAAGIEFFEQHIRPLLVEHCYECHSSQSAPVQGGLRLDDRQSLAQGGDSGPAIVAGDPAASLLLTALRYDELQMPPDGQLPGETIALVEKWIAMGAPDPRLGTNDTTLSPSSATATPAAAHDWWSFREPQRQPRPSVRHFAWPRQELDWFVLAAMESRGLEPAEEADRRMWLRRVYFDLIGLPPTYEQVEAFMHDTHPAAYERIVDQLLSSAEYGQHWARMWLDLARFAEDQAHIVGDDRSLCYPNAHLYRDWVITALNDDLPFDQFIRYQLAADLLPNAERHYPALGFLGLGPKYYNRGALEVQADEWDDRIDTVTRGLLGLTVSCARCHDHKFDPISMSDYYALAGVFASTEMFNAPLDLDKEKKDDGNAKSPEDAMHIVREAKAKNVAIAIRGNVKKPGEIVQRGFLELLAREETRQFWNGSGRLELAEAIADPANPLTARVIVNRIWGAHFGQPLVTTPSNFGHLGQAPSHPELLDDLAHRFVAHGWSLKWLHREIVLSATYRQTSHACAPSLSLDRDNTWLSRMNRKRLPVEQWRDAMLASGGVLDAGLGGKSIDPASSTSRRRTIYAEISRFELNPFLARFDFPDANVHSARRTPTTTPLQKLFLLNSPFVVELADQITENLSQSSESRPLSETVADLYRRIHQRAPTVDEQTLATQFLTPADGSAEPEREQLRDLVQALLISNETIFVD
jgi:hypothetical protein